MDNIPIDYKAQSFMDYFNRQPSQVKGVWNADVEYHKRYLWTQIYSVFDFKLPDGWELNWFRYWLFQFGSIAVLYTKEMGWIAYPYGIQKLNLYYQPREIIVTSPFLKDEKLGRIGVNSEIVKIMDDYYSLADIVTRYATQLSNIDKSINIALMNSNVAFVFAADSKKQADTIKEAYGTATTGQPLITINKDALGNGIETLFPNVKNNFIVQDLLQAKRTIINEFLTKIGIRNANYEKKERLNSQEVNENNDETKSIVSIIYENIDSAFQKLNSLSGDELGLAVSYVYDYTEKEVSDDGENNIVRNDSV